MKLIGNGREKTMNEVKHAMGRWPGEFHSSYILLLPYFALFLMGGFVSRDGPKNNLIRSQFWVGLHCSLDKVGFGPARGSCGGLLDERFCAACVKHIHIEK